MVSSHTERHLAENEMVFREYNERVQRGFDELEQLARQEGRQHLKFEDDVPLHFYCECSDENCEARILLQPSTYANIHKHRKRFIVVKGHDVPEVESIVYKGPNYSVVEKMADLPKFATGLHDTDVDKG